MRSMTAIALAPLLALSLAAPAAAGELAGVEMPDSVQAAGQTLKLNGMAVRKKFFIKVYVAGLYLPAPATSADAVLGADEARRTVMHFVYDVGADSLCEGWQEGLEANTPDASAEVKKQFDTLCSWMQEVEKGQTMVFTYLPGQGTEVEVAGANKGTIEGKAFADALFACWIGPKPGPGEAFKKGLLSG
jgi:hypothetical protein